MAFKEQVKKLRQRLRGFDGSFEQLGPLVEDEPDALVAVLRSRAALRSSADVESAELLPRQGWRVGSALFAADVALGVLGAPWSRSSHAETQETRWFKELRGGLDTFARICWMLRFGYTFAAAASTRLHLERWTLNVASSHGIERDEGEDDADYIDRAWAVYGKSSHGVGVGRRWSELSELVHGRSIDLQGTAVTLGSPLPLATRIELHKYILETAEISLRQVRGCIDAALRERDVRHRFRGLLQMDVSRIPSGPTPPDFLSVFYEPLSYQFVFSPVATTTSEWGASYRRIVKGATGRRSFNPPPPWMAIEERWVRSISDARSSFDRERMQLGTDFDPAHLDNALNAYQAITEMANLVAARLADLEHGESLRVAAAALEASWVLWLNDVDDSLLAMRATLELTARARVYRTKPDAAAKLAARGKAATPHRWIEKAGWGRQSAFTRALGEFAHIQTRSRHRASRSLLTSIQRDATEGYEMYTARAGALEEVARMLAHEVAATVTALDPKLGTRFRHIVLQESQEESERNLESWLNTAMSFRSHDFGTADYAEVVGPEEGTAGSAT